MKRINEAFDGFKDGVQRHLESAVPLLAQNQTETFRKAWWELQMSVESALKVFSVQKSSVYLPSHDLARLLADAQRQGLKFDANRFDIWPDKDTVINFRYGKGRPGDILRMYESYRLTISPAKAVAGAMDRMRLGQARFEIGRPPWMTN